MVLQSLPIRTGEVTRLVSVARADRRPGLEVSLHRFIVLTGVLAVTGGILVAPVILGRSDAHLPSSLGPARGETAQLNAVIETSFGAVTVEFVEKIPGLTSQDLAGMTHGIQDLVPAGKELVLVAATITNASDAPIAYAPGLFEVRLEDGGRVPVSRSAAVSGVLQPDASIDVRLEFVVPGDGGNVWLRFVGDPGVTEIDLGDTLISKPEGEHGHAP